MGFWKKLFGKDFEESVAEAEQLLEAGRAGEALLAFTQALEQAKGVAQERVEQVRDRMAAARNQLARGHLDEGRQYAEQGLTDRATECFETAIEVGADGEIALEARRLLDALEAADARSGYEDDSELTDDERFEVLSGSWEDARAEELESYGEPFRRAFLLLHDDQAEQAVALMKELLTQHPDGLYLRLELALAQRQAGQLSEAAENLKQFLAELEAEEEELSEAADEETSSQLQANNSRVQAHARLAEIYLEQDQSEAAEQELQTLVDLLPEQSEPYVHLGHFLRSHERFEEALEVLEEGQRHMGALRPDMRVMRELGLTHQALGHQQQAIETLRAVVDYDASLGNFDFDHFTAVPLAELYEKAGQLDRAADLYRHLAAGSHSPGHYTYNKEAGRLLAAINQKELARRYLTRAQELAPDDNEREVISETLSALH